MSLRKVCSPSLPMDHPMHCSTSPQCEHYWFSDFRVNQKRYRLTTETANKQLAKSIEAKERARVLEGRHQIRRLPDITFGPSPRRTSAIMRRSTSGASSAISRFC